MSRKKLIEKLLKASTSIPIIVCFRAEEKTVMKKDRGQTIVASEWSPVCGKEFPFEMTCFFMLHSDKPGYINPIKLQEQHKDIFPLDKPLNEESGKRIAEWAKGGEIKSTDKPKPDFDRSKALKQIMVLFKERGITEKHDILANVEHAISRKGIKSLKDDLTDDEIKTVIEKVRVMEHA